MQITGRRRTAVEQTYISRTSGIKTKDKIGYMMGDLASCLVF